MSDPMIDIDNLTRLEAAATPVPWRQDPRDTSYIRHPNGWQTVGSVNLNHHDAALIAAMRNAIKPLIAEVTALRAQIAKQAPVIEAVIADANARAAFRYDPTEATWVARDAASNVLDNIGDDLRDAR